MLKKSVKKNESVVESVRWGLASSEPCKPTTSACFSSTHFVRRKKTRSSVIPVRFTPEERNALHSSSQKIHVSLSEYIRRAALKRRLPNPPVAEVNLETYQELSRIGNNLNQLVRSIHEGKFAQIDLAIVTNLSGLVKQVGFQVLGETKFDS